MIIEELKQVFMKLGAEEAQAEIAAKQLIKRAEQIAQEKSITDEEALKELLSRIFNAQS
ncbi:MAG: hypothetical protein ACJ0BQ_02195 [Coraliomargaritaceae bacterium]|jgi:FtsZ-binding cell division protein ZapB